MRTGNRILTAVLVCMFLLSSCVPSSVPVPTQTSSPAPTVTTVPTPTRRPEVNIALNKPVRVSAFWVVDPPEKAVNGNHGDWWGAGGPVPQWIEVDLEGIYSISRIRVINQGPTGSATYLVYGRGQDHQDRLLHEFKGAKSENQSLVFAPETPWEGISTIRIEINSGLGWVGFREVQVFSREEPKFLPEAAGAGTPLFSAQVDVDELVTITPDNAILMKQLAMLGRGPINKMAWSPDGGILAAASPLGIWLYDGADLKSEPRLLAGHTRDVLGVTFSTDGRLILSGSQDGTVKHWDAVTGDLKRTVSLWDDFSYEVGDQKRAAEVWSIAFSPDGKTMAAGAFDGAIHVWNPMTGKKIGDLKGHQRVIADLQFNQDGTLLASVSMDGSLMVWDVVQESQLANLLLSGQVTSLGFSPEGGLAYGGVGMPIQFWDPATGEVTAGPEDLTGILSLDFSPDGSTLASSNLVGQLQMLDMETGTLKVFKEHADWIMKMVYSPDGKTLATYAWDGTLRLWDAATADQLAALEIHTSPVNSVAFSPDGSLLASAGSDNSIRLWEVGTNSLRTTLWGHQGSVSSVAFSPDGSLMASGSFDKTVRLWDVTTGRQEEILLGHESFVRSVAFSPDGKLVASAGTDTTVRLWEVATGESLFTLEGHTAEVQDLAFSPDGKWLASASVDKSLRIWDVATGQEIGSLPGNKSFAISAAFSPDGTIFASGGGDHSLYVFNLKTVSGGIMGLNRIKPIGHPGWVTDAVFSPDGRVIASANVSTTSYWVAPGEIHLYSSQTGYPLNLLRAHTKRVTGVAFSPNGKLLASGSADGSVRLWGVQGDKWLTALQPTAEPTSLALPSSDTASWRDDFDGSLAEGWHWKGENSDKWNLTETPGFLRIYVSPYKANGPRENVLLRPAPKGDFAIETHIVFEPDTNFQFAGLYLYQDDNNSLALGRAFCNIPGDCVGNGIYFDYIKDTAFTGGNYANRVDNPNEAYLRLERRSGIIKAFFSYEGVTWFEIGNHLIPADFQIKEIGLVASGDGDKSDKDIPADFDFFELTEDL